MFLLSSAGIVWMLIWVLEMLQILWLLHLTGILAMWESKRCLGKPLSLRWAVCANSPRRSREGCLSRTLRTANSGPWFFIRLFAPATWQKRRQEKRNGPSNRNSLERRRQIWKRIPFPNRGPGWWEELVLMQPETDFITVPEEKSLSISRGHIRLREYRNNDSPISDNDCNRYIVFLWYLKLGYCCSDMTTSLN